MTLSWFSSRLDSFVARARKYHVDVLLTRLMQLLKALSSKLNTSFSRCSRYATQRSKIFNRLQLNLSPDSELYKWLYGLEDDIDNNHDIDKTKLILSKTK